MAPPRIAETLVAAVAGAGLCLTMQLGLRRAYYLYLEARRRAERSRLLAPDGEGAKMRAGQRYVESSPEIAPMRSLTHLACEEYNQQPPGCRPRARILRELFGASDPAAPPFISPPFYCDYGAHISVGRGFYCNFGCVLLDVAEIRIGDNCFLAPGVKLITATHPMDHLERRREECGHPITIGDDVWIGADAIVLPGVTIGSRAVVGAGAVVTKDVPEGAVVAGCPARVLRVLPNGSDGPASARQLPATA